MCVLLLSNALPITRLQRLSFGLWMWLFAGLVLVDIPDKSSCFKIRMASHLSRCGLQLFSNIFFFFFIFGCVGSSFLCEGSLQLRQAGATLRRGARASLVAEHRLQTRRLSSCGSRAQLLRGMWDPPRPGLEPVSPALAGRFPTTAPPGKPILNF